MSYDLGVKFPIEWDVDVGSWISLVTELAETNRIPGFEDAYLINRDGVNLNGGHINATRKSGYSLIRPAVGMTNLTRPKPFIGLYDSSDEEPNTATLFADGRDDKSIYSVTVLLVIVAAARVLRLHKIDDYSSVWCGKGRCEFDANESIFDLLRNGGIEVAALRPV